MVSRKSYSSGQKGEMKNVENYRPIVNPKIYIFHPCQLKMPKYS